MVASPFMVSPSPVSTQVPPPLMVTVSTPIVSAVTSMVGFPEFISPTQAYSHSPSDFATILPVASSEVSS